MYFWILPLYTTQFVVYHIALYKIHNFSRSFRKPQPPSPEVKKTRVSVYRLWQQCPSQTGGFTMWITCLLKRSRNLNRWECTLCWSRIDLNN